MASSPEFTAFLLEQLAPLGAVRAKRMFGGYGVYLDEVIFAIVASDVLYLKEDEGNHAALAALGTDLFRPWPDRDTALPYREVPGDLLEQRGRLVELARLAVGAGLRARKPAPAKRRR